MLPTRVEIPSGPTTPILIAGLPLLAVLLLGAGVGIPFVHLKSIKVFLLVIPLWGFLRYHTRKDAMFLQKVLGQLAFQRYYFHG